MHIDIVNELKRSMISVHKSLELSVARNSTEKTHISYTRATTELLHIPKRLQTHDTAIMDKMGNINVPINMILIFNPVRLWFGVYSLA